MVQTSIQTQKQAKPKPSQPAFFTKKGEKSHPSPTPSQKSYPSPGFQPQRNSSFKAALVLFTPLFQSRRTRSIAQTYLIKSGNDTIVITHPVLNILKHVQYQNQKNPKK
jgi:hypothetical protein